MEVDVTFQNTLPEVVQVVWVNEAGSEVLAAYLGAGGTHRTKTWDSHAWRWLRLDGSVLQEIASIRDVIDTTQQTHNLKGGRGGGGGAAARLPPLLPTTSAAAATGSASASASPPLPSPSSTLIIKVRNCISLSFAQDYQAVLAAYHRRTGGGGGGDNERSGGVGMEVPVPSPLYVVATDTSPYMEWQMQMMAYSYAEAGQARGILVRIMCGHIPPAGSSPPPQLLAPVRTYHFPRCDLYRQDRYAIYNSMVGLQRWLRVWGEEEAEVAALVRSYKTAAAGTDDGAGAGMLSHRGRSIILLDADFLFARPFALARAGIAPKPRWAEVPGMPSPPHSPVAQFYEYMDPAKVPLLARRAAAAARVGVAQLQKIGKPYIMVADDWVRILPLWIERTHNIRQDKVLRNAAWGNAGPWPGAKSGAVKKDPDLSWAISWGADMWGYSAAAAELGMFHRVMPRLSQRSAFPGEVVEDTVWLHYCNPHDFHGAAAGRPWQFDKYNFYHRAPTSESVRALLQAPQYRVVETFRGAIRARACCNVTLPMHVNVNVSALSRLDRWYRVTDCVGGRAAIRESRQRRRAATRVVGGGERDEASEYSERGWASAVLAQCQGEIT